MDAARFEIRGFRFGFSMGFGGCGGEIGFDTGFGVGSESLFRCIGVRVRVGVGVSLTLLVVGVSALFTGGIYGTLNRFAFFASTVLAAGTPVSLIRLVVRSLVTGVSFPVFFLSNFFVTGV